MATLIFSAVGTAIGGPIGGALGALVGQQLDQNLLFKPAAREGPRIQELAVQTSSYGTQIPRVFGRMRIAGSVIWATDLKETRNTEGGKGRPKTTTYSYSACFAVALSSRPIEAIGRIWADGKILRGAAGDFKTPTGFRFVDGSEDQQLDSLIGSAEGVGATPAYRGLALAIFEDMELADYGNRIPSLTFEIVGDDGSISLAKIMDDISDHRILLSSSEQLHGYAASGENRRAALAPIAESYLLSFSVDQGLILGRSRTEMPLNLGNIDRRDSVQEVGGIDVEEPQFESVPETKIPRNLALRYYEPDRDYQSGLQNSFRPGLSRAIARVDFPAAISSSQAKHVSQNLVWNLYNERSSAAIHVPHHSQLGRPGSFVQFDNKNSWIIRSWEFRSGTVSLSMTSIGHLTATGNVQSDGGRSVPDQDAIAGVTRLMVVDLPFAPDTPNQAATSAQLFAVAAGEEGWRNADLYQGLPNGSIGEFVGKISSPGTLGLMEQVFAPSSPFLWDLHTSAVVRLHHPDMVLKDADEAQLSAGKNIALIGQEIVQFAKAKPLGNGRYALSSFTRGLGGTEQHIDTHDPDEEFVLFEPTVATSISPNHFTLFQAAEFAALGRDDAMPVTAAIQVPGRALKPWQPVHLNYRFNSSGDLELVWIRRSRAGSSWVDYVEIPLAEEVEEYLVQWGNSANNQLGVAVVDNPKFTIPENQISAYRDQEINPICFMVQQRGQYALSAPAELSISI
jgi:Putative phage tail protein